MSSQELDHHGYGVHFFKVILETTLQRGKLKVPRSFSSRHWQGISNPVSLWLPNGTEWKVYWLKIGGDVLLSNGWQEFTEYSCLDVSYFLVFRYEGNSQFNVIVFGKNGLEIKYPSNKDPNEERIEVHDSDCDLQIVEDCSPMEGKREKSSSLSSQIRKKMKINPKEEKVDETKHEKKEIDFDNSMHMNTGSSRSDTRKKIRTFHEKVRKMFQSKNEHFICAMHKSYIERDLLIIPIEFSNSYLHMEGNATLFVNKERSWDVELKINSYGQLTFVTGWRKFLIDNELKIGDVCAFELNKNKCKGLLSFKVAIFRFEENSSTHPSKGQEGLSHEPLSLNTLMTPKANKSELKNDLQIHIKPPFNSVRIPFTYCKNYLNESGRYVTLLVGKRSWEVKLLYYESNHFARFSVGWREFVKDCHLEEGDVCHFKLVDEKNLLFNVSIEKGKPRN